MITYDRVCETSTTTGTGSFALDAAITGYRRFSAVCAANDMFYYLIEEVDARGIASGAWETGLGKYSATNTLTRILVHDSSTASTISFAAGTKRVHLALTASAVRQVGTYLYRATDLTAQNTTAILAVSWGSSSSYLPYNGPAFYSGGSPTRITIPANTAGPDTYLARLSAQILIGNATVNEKLECWVYKNGAAPNAANYGSYNSVLYNTTSPVIRLNTPSIQVTAGDYFELMIKVAADTSIDILTGSWFAFEDIGRGL